MPEKIEENVNINALVTPTPGGDQFQIGLINEPKEQKNERLLDEYISSIEVDPITQFVQDEIINKKLAVIQLWLEINHQDEEEKKRIEKLTQEDFWNELKEGKHKHAIQAAYGNNKVIESCITIEIEGYDKLHKQFPQLKPIDWQQGKNASEKIVEYPVAEGKPSLKLTEKNQDVTLPDGIGQAKNVRSIDIPTRIPEELGGAHFTFTSRTLDGNNMPDPAIRTSVHYNTKGELIEANFPAGMKFADNKPESPGYFTHNGKTYTSGITLGKYEELMKEVAKNHGKGALLNELPEQSKDTVEISVEKEVQTVVKEVDRIVQNIMDESVPQDLSKPLTPINIITDLTSASQTSKEKTHDSLHDTTTKAKNINRSDSLDSGLGSFVTSGTNTPLAAETNNTTETLNAAAKKLNSMDNTQPIIAASIIQTAKDVQSIVGVTTGKNGVQTTTSVDADPLPTSKLKDNDNITPKEQTNTSALPQEIFEAYLKVTKAKNLPAHGHGPKSADADKTVNPLEKKLQHNNMVAGVVQQIKKNLEEQQDKSSEAKKSNERAANSYQGAYRTSNQFVGGKVGKPQNSFGR